MENKLPGAATLLRTQKKDSQIVRDNVAVTALLLDRKKTTRNMVKTKGTTGGSLQLKNPRSMKINPSAPSVLKKKRQRQILIQRGAQFTNTEKPAVIEKNKQSRYIKRRRQQELIRTKRLAAPQFSVQNQHTRSSSKTEAPKSDSKPQTLENPMLIDRKTRTARYKSSLVNKNAKMKKGAKTGKQSIKKMLVTSGMEKMLSDGGKKDDLGTRSVSSVQKAYYKAKRAKEMVRRAYKGAKYTVKAVSFLAKVFAKLVSMIVSALGAIGLPVLLMAFAVVIVAAVVMSFFGSTSATETDTDLSDAYLYVTQLDAAKTYNIRTENFGADQYQFYMNGNRVEGAAIQIRSDVEAMLALMESKYQTSTLYTEIEGALGGHSISEELANLHEYLYQYTTTVNTIKEGEKEVKTKFISVKTQLLESWVERNTWYLSKSDYEVLKIMGENGYFLLNKEIAPLFGEETTRIYQDYGFYVNPVPEMVKDAGMLLSVKKGISTYAGFSGIVAEVGEDYVKVQTGIKEFHYYNIIPSVTNGQEIKKGETIGTTSTNVIRVVYYKSGLEVCPTVYMEGLDKTTAGGGVGNSDIVAVALSQVGQVGGQPYWSWYGFGGRVEWCACFVSWCANQCGYLDSGVIFRHSGCTTGVAEWRRRGLFQEAGYVPKAGDIIYFDYDDPLYGKSYEDADHVGIVQSSDGVYVYTIEGNSNDSVRQNTYSLGYADIKGYATPLY